MENILRPDENYAKVPMIAERAENLRQVGKILNEKYNGKFVFKCIQS